jgi:hypothetical protein
VRKEEEENVLKGGDKVVIELPDRYSLEINLPEEMWRFNGQKTRVSAKHVIVSRGQYGPYFELEGIVSRYGKPYVFLPMWLRKVKR